MTPPSPPTQAEKWLYLEQNKKWYYSLGVGSFLLLLVGMSLFICLKEEFRLYIPWVVLFGSYIGVSYWIGIFGKSFNLRKHQQVKLDWFDRVGFWGEDYPVIDVFIPVCGENINIVRNTIFHAVSMTYPDDKLKIHILDDGDDTEVRQAAKLYKANYIVRKNRPELRKAGNLRHAFAKTNGDFILILDTDFAPRRDMLEEMLPWMDHDEEIAIVQSPQYFNTKTSVGWIQKGAAYVQELFYRLVQTNRDSIYPGAAICVGSCGLYRRKALVPFGGTYPINYSEDVHTGYQLLSNCWKIKYLPINLAKGLCPEHLRGFFSQQHRWASGSLSLCSNRMFWGAKQVGGHVKLAYLTGFTYYLATALGVICIPLAGIMMVWFAPEYVFWWNCLYYLPSFLFGTVVMSYWTRAPFGLYALCARQVSYYSHLFALKDKLLGNKMHWIPTGARHKESDNYGKFMALFSIWSVAQYLFLVGGCLHHMGRLSNLDFYPHLFFGTFYFLCNMRVLWTAYIEES